METLNHVEAIPCIADKGRLPLFIEFCINSDGVMCVGNLDRWSQEEDRSRCWWIVV